MAISEVIDFLHQMIREELVARTELDNNVIKIQFLNGKAFKIQVEQI